MAKTKSPAGDTKQGTRVLRGRVVKYYLNSDKENVTPPDKKLVPAKTSSRRRSSTSGISPIKRQLSRRDFTNLVEVGRGGFSVVYRAHLISRRTNCVLKFLHHEKLRRMNTELEDVALERSLFQILDHVNIPRLLGYFETPSSSVFVMEYCDSGDLYDYLYPSSSRKSFPRTFERNKHYIQQLVCALEYFQKTTKHIHMDVKPENVLVTSKDNVKLTDFGCCVPMGSPRQIHRKHNGGTKPYRPPEMLNSNNSQFDSTVDVWGIGCITFQLMVPSGDHPFFGRDPESHSLSEDTALAFVLMNNFKKGLCEMDEYDRMDPTCKTFLRQTIGTDREDRPLVSKLHETAFLTHTARVFNPCL